MQDLYKGHIKGQLAKTGLIMGLRDLAYPGMANYPYTDVAPMDRYLAEGREDLAGLSSREIEGRFGGPSFRSNEVNPFSAIMADTLRKTGPVGNFMTQWIQEGLDTHARNDDLPLETLGLAALEMPIGTIGKPVALAGYGIAAKGAKLSKLEKQKLAYAQTAMKGATAGSERQLAKSLYAETKAFEGLQDEWRIWVNDHDASVVDNFLSPKTLETGKDFNVSDVLKHPDLYKKVPETKGVKVVFSKTMKDANAEFYVPVDKSGKFLGPARIKINVNNLEVGKNGKYDADRIRSIIVHELSHFEDARAGFSTGGSPKFIEELSTKEFPKVRRELRQARQKAEMASARIITLESQKASKEEIIKVKKYLRNVIAEHDQLKERYTTLNEVVKNTYKGKSGKHYYAYRHQLGGEVRAYDAQNRLEVLSPKENLEDMPAASKHGAYGPAQNKDKILHMSEAEKQYGDYTNITSGIEP